MLELNHFESHFETGLEGIVALHVKDVSGGVECWKKEDDKEREKGMGNGKVWSVVDSWVKCRIDSWGGLMILGVIFMCKFVWLIKYRFLLLLLFIFILVEHYFSVIGQLPLGGAEILDWGPDKI